MRDADAIVVGTPIYKASFSGVLKTFLDLLPQDGLAGKIVLPLATGGSQSHMLALDYALRPVLASLAPRHILPSIYATSEQLPWDAENGLRPSRRSLRASTPASSSCTTKSSRRCRAAAAAQARAVAA